MRRSPPAVGMTTVRLAAMALAEDGTPQRPTTGNVRFVFAASAGPPDGPAGFLVSATRQGVTVKKPTGAAQDNVGSIATVFEPAAEHPAAAVTLTEIETGPDGPGWKMIADVPAPEVTMAFVSAQAYVAPGPALGTDAAFPAEYGQTAAGAVIPADGFRVTVTWKIAETVQPLLATVTLMVR